MILTVHHHKKITKSVKHNNIIYANATYKINLKGFTVLLASTTYKGKKIHLFGIALAKTEKTCNLIFLIQLNLP